VYLEGSSSDQERLKGGSKRASTSALGSIVIVISVWMLVLMVVLVSMLAMACGRVCSRARRDVDGAGFEVAR